MNLDFFPSIKAKRKLTEDGISQLLDKSEDECKEMDSSTLDSKGDGEINHTKREISDYSNLHVTLFKLNFLKFKNS